MNFNDAHISKQITAFRRAANLRPLHARLSPALLLLLP
jgi:hypothetical protein